MGKRNEKIIEMHELYMLGYSLEQVGETYNRTRQSVWELFKRHNLEIRPRKKPLPYIRFNGKKYTKRNHGYYAKTRDDRCLLHRDVWEYHNGDIPDGYDIHHLDGNKENNDISNLECLPKSEHTRKYSPHNNQYTKGRKR